MWPNLYSFTGWEKILCHANWEAEWHGLPKLSGWWKLRRSCLKDWCWAAQAVRTLGGLDGLTELGGCRWIHGTGALASAARLYRSCEGFRIHLAHAASHCVPPVQWLCLHWRGWVSSGLKGSLSFAVVPPRPLTTSRWSWVSPSRTPTLRGWWTHAFCSLWEVQGHGSSCWCSGWTQEVLCGPDLRGNDRSDKQGFPLQQGVSTHGRTYLLLL